MAAARAQAASAGIQVRLRCRKGRANPPAAHRRRTSRAGRSPVPRRTSARIRELAVRRRGTSRNRPVAARPNRGTRAGPFAASLHPTRITPSRGQPRGTSRNRSVMARSRRDTRVAPFAASQHLTRITPSRGRHRGTSRNRLVMARSRRDTRAGRSAATHIRSPVGFRPVRCAGPSRGAPAGRVTAQIVPASIGVPTGAGSGGGGTELITGGDGPGSIAQNRSARRTQRCDGCKHAWRNCSDRVCRKTVSLAS
jgi:hypothetical protein